MKSIVLLLTAAGVLGASVVYSQTGADVVKAKGCLNCHDVDKKKVGPSFKDTAAKYKNDKDAEAKLVGALKEGKGHPKVGASDAELKAAVGHVLSTK